MFDVSSALRHGGEVEDEEVLTGVGEGVGGEGGRMLARWLAGSLDDFAEWKVDTTTGLIPA